ncbi:MAG: ComF family protein [Acidobacteria bacterium]|nr:ComF family protein [Acidobacteriota bacterium]
MCGLCRGGLTGFDWGRGYGIYEGPLERVIQLLKYDRMRPLARELALRMANLVGEAGRVDLLAPVPLHRKRQWERGFNQAELLASELGRICGIPVDGVLLRRERATETQTGLAHNQRRLNVRGAFAARRPVEGRHVALVDDVITTGATMSECARVLKQAGAARVVALAAARARLSMVDVT